MLNKRINRAIIAISKTFVPVVLLLLLAPHLIQFSTEFKAANHFFKLHQTEFLIIHGFFYLALYWLWPKLIRALVNHYKHEVDDAQIKLAIQARVYLVSALVFLELLVWWK